MTKFDKAMLETAQVWANLSHATRAKIGCVIAKDNRIIAHGFNGRPQLLPNQCEDENNCTLPDVVHAEMNAVLFAAKHGIALEGTTAYITAAPCKQCLPKLAVAGIKKIVYIDSYISSAGSYDQSYYDQLGIEKVTIKSKESI